MRKTKEELKIYKKEYKLKNKEQIKEYRLKHKEKINKRARERYAENPKLKATKQKYRQNNKEYISEWHRERHLKNKEHDNEIARIYQKNQKLLAFQKVSKKEIPTCEICGIDDLKLLTLDHKNNDGQKWRISRTGTKKDSGFYNLIIQDKINPEEFQSLQVLCFNCNCNKQRSYFDIPLKDQDYQKRYQIKIWNKALKFFGPCKTCGNSDIKNLTVSHIHNNGAELRRNGQNRGIILLANFNKQNWPESLKEDYCLECFNCNCSRRYLPIPFHSTKINSI
jgi:hypothetical protein